MKKITFLAFAILFSLYFGNVFAQNKAATVAITIGIVDVEAVVKEMPEAIAGDKEVMELSKKYQDTIAKRQTELETKVQNFQKQKAMMAVDKQQQEEEKLQTEVRDFQTYVTEMQNEVAQAREKLLEPIRVKVKSAIETVAKEEKITLVLHKDASMVLYSEPKFDITFRVIDKIKRDK